MLSICAADFPLEHPSPHAILDLYSKLNAAINCHMQLPLQYSSLSLDNKRVICIFHLIKLIDKYKNRVLDRKIQKKERKNGIIICCIIIWDTPVSGVFEAKKWQ